MRVSTQMLYDQNMRGVSDAQSSWLNYGEQLSTGLRVNKPSDDPVAASQAVVLSQAQAQNDQFKLARTFATQKMSLEESVLSQVTTAIQSAQEKVVYANDGALGDNDRASVATDLEGIRDQILNLANSTDGNGRYIFAGYKTESAPFSDATGSVVYNGGDIPLTQQVDTSRTMTAGHTGSRVFDSLASNVTPEPDGTPSETNLFRMLDSAISALKTPAADLDAAGKGAVDKTNRGLHNALDNVLTVRAELGSQLNELSQLDDLGDERTLGQDTQMSDLVNADWNASVSNYEQQQAVLQAAYKTFSDMQGMSLFQLNSR